MDTKNTPDGSVEENENFQRSLVQAYFEFLQAFTLYVDRERDETTVGPSEFEECCTQFANAVAAIIRRNPGKNWRTLDVIHDWMWRGDGPPSPYGTGRLHVPSDDQREWIMHTIVAKLTEKSDAITASTAGARMKFQTLVQETQMDADIFNAVPMLQDLAIVQNGVSRHDFWERVRQQLGRAQTIGEYCRQAADRIAAISPEDAIDADALLVLHCGTADPARIQEFNVLAKQLRKLAISDEPKIEEALELILNQAAVIYGAKSERVRDLRSQSAQDLQKLR